MYNYEPGQWNVICDRCGFEYKSRQLRKEWTGLRVCHGGGTNDCFEVRHPQERLRAKKDTQSVPWSRPEGTRTELTTNEVTPEDL